VKSPENAIHPQLLTDCHVLGQLGAGHLLLSRNALLHWFILVPDTDCTDLLDLPAPVLARVMADCQAVSRVLKEQLAYPKVNFAGLGNVVPQMHLHIVGRREGDACWPQPIWGNLAGDASWSADDLEQLAAMLQADCGLRYDQPA
jgi:diadenosine tetraphosphate (Ap4A) HIT family hydrolase